MGVGKGAREKIHKLMWQRLSAAPFAVFLAAAPLTMIPAFYSSSLGSPKEPEIGRSRVVV